MTPPVFHNGEIAIQKRLGLHEKMAKFADRVVRDHMPGQHRDFYQKLPFVALGHVDEKGMPWASLLVGDGDGFIQSPDDKTLVFRPSNLRHSILKQHAEQGSRVGLLGIELATRRRNRMSGQVSHIDEDTLTLQVLQSFGNCPQYIQTRYFQYVPEQEREPEETRHVRELGVAERQLISTSDTFFVASYFHDGSDSVANGADVSHRGGRPGFVYIEDNGDLLIPDYAGNNHFNTLGNFAQHPYAGLLFVDFEKGHLLHLTGDVEILWDDPRTEHFNGALRLWRFRLRKGHWSLNALPFKTRFGEFSPNSLLTGDWQQANQLTALQQDRNKWQKARIVERTRESSAITSFVIEPEDHPHGVWEAGQFLTIQLDVKGEQQVRTYTLSSAPDDQRYRISVKREEGGTVSNWLHDHMPVGSELFLRLPSGAFHLQSDKPSVLIGAGVGLTPFVSMLRQASYDITKRRIFRPITFIAQVRDTDNRPFFEELNTLSAHSDGLFRVIWVMSNPDLTDEKGKDYHFKGRLDRDVIRSVLPLDDYEYYLCGPAEFMQTQYDNLLSLGAQDMRIFAEGFGPAALTRQSATPQQPVQQLPVAENAVVTFSETGVEQAWQKEDGNLLDFAERHGMSPAYGCRNGQCGSCKVKITSGHVSHTQAPGVELAEDEALICCAVPADNGEEVSSVTLTL